MAHPMIKAAAAAAAAAALLVQPLPALAQGRCITETQVSAMVVYAVPLALEALRTNCAARLSPDGFLATGAEALSQRYAAEAEAAWPQAFEGLKLFAGRGNGIAAGGEAGTGAGALALLERLPPETLRPIVDELVALQIAGALRPEQCGRLERLVGALAPFEPAEAGRLAGVLAGLAGVRDPQICPVE